MEQWDRGAAPSRHGDSPFDAAALRGLRQNNIDCWNNVQVSGSESLILSHSDAAACFHQLLRGIVGLFQSAMCSRGDSQMI